MPPEYANILSTTSNNQLSLLEDTSLLSLEDDVGAKPDSVKGQPSTKLNTSALNKNPNRLLKESIKKKIYFVLW